MAEPAEVRAEARAPLSKERVLQTAVELADSAGIEALSMRRLARELGVEAMSLYHYVRSKDELLEGMLDIVLSQIETPADEREWKAAIRRTALSSRDALARHPWAATAESPGRVRPDRLRFMEFVLGTLRKAGFSPELTDHGYHAIDSHITGFTLWLANMPFSTSAELADLAKGFLKELPEDEFPYMVEHVHQHIRAATRPKPVTPEPTEFEFGLDLILDGLERLRTR
jgi:AcrR family transcriptional regulator